MAMAENITASDRWYRGKHKVFEYTVKTRAETVVDISDFTAFTWGIYQEGAEPPADPVFAVKTLGSGIAVTDGPGGKLQVTIEPEDTDAGVQPGKYDVQLTGTDGDGLTDVLVMTTAVLRQSPTFD